MIFFGDENQESGSVFIPDIPYFLALFLGEKERPGKAYLANYWQKGGRYFASLVMEMLVNLFQKWISPILSKTNLVLTLHQLPGLR